MEENIRILQSIRDARERGGAAILSMEADAPAHSYFSPIAALTAAYSASVIIIFVLSVVFVLFFILFIFLVFIVI